MKRQASDATPTHPEALQNRLLFWLAAALAPESAPWYVGYAPSLHSYTELMRQAGARDPADNADPESSEPELIADAPRRAA